MMIRLALVAGWAVGTVMMALVSLAAPQPVLADCAVGDVACVQMEPTSGGPGTLVTMNPFGPGCEPGPANLIEFVAGAYDEAATYTSTALQVSYEGDRRVGAFTVPLVPAGTYGLALRCDSDVAIARGNPYGLLGIEFHVVDLPATDTDGPTIPAAGSSSIAMGLVIAGLLGVIGWRWQTAGRRT